ncbi:DUF1631 family protein [Cognatilysobacter bugurensis]|uniref:DUF1631 domain-containing protein n=1 Tax=Cognatilysobacter bugurensis TaxID=543356 RepID=A0A918T4K5_9GAMM|nr:DUF1631 family protein [Lysobacter bugurensis]GHA89674.1 hypothetical protein GCM10007067_29440 [Lysobacter bugurensis]
MSVHSLTAASASRTDPVRVLEEMKRLAVEQLGALPHALAQAVEKTLQSTAGGPSYEEQTALALLRQNGASHVMRFRQQIATGFDEFRGASSITGGDRLDLVGEQQLDLHLTGQRLSDMLEQRYQRPLEVMKQRLDAVASALGAHVGSNPVAPARLVSAFIETYAETGLPAAFNGVMFRQYQLALGRVLDELYVRINAMLATAGYGQDVNARRAAPQTTTPSTRAWLGEQVEARASAPPVRSAAPDGHGESAAPPVVSSRLVAELAGLRAQLHARRNPDAAAMHTGAPAPARPLPVRDVATIASVLQSEPPDAYARALAAPGRLSDAIRDQMLDGARRLGLGNDRVCLGEQEEDAIDLVSMLFESLFRTHALQDRARRLYARLVLPYVKVALAGDALFVQTQHPARRLLDAMTEACEDNDGSTPQDRELLERASAVSQRIVAEYHEDLAIFELAHAELEALLVQQRRRGELQESRAAKATFGRERLAQARASADAALDALLSRAPITAAVAEFLSAPWRHHLVQTLLRDGADCERVQQIHVLGDALVNADALAAQARGRDLADCLIALQPSIVQCLGSLGLDENAARHGLAMLVRDLATPDAERRTHAVVPLAGDEPANDDPRLCLAGGTATVPHDPGVAAMIRRLQPGEWMRLIDAQGEATSVKIAWVSPLTSRLLLVNRRGMRVLVAAPEELAAMVGAGRLMLGGERTPFSEAMLQLRQRLDHAVGQH